MSLITRNAGSHTSRRLGLTGLLFGAVMLVHLLIGSTQVTGTAAAVVGSAVFGSLALSLRSAAGSSTSRQINCQAPGCPDIQMSPTLDLTARGFFVQTEALYPVLTRFEFELRLPHVDQPVRGTGVVRWLHRTMPFGMGCEIVQLKSPESGKLLDRGEQVSPLARISRVASSLRT